MSMRDTTMGIGICCENLKTTPAKLKDLIAMTTEFKSEIWDDIQEFDSLTDYWDLATNFEPPYVCCKLGFYIATVMNELEPYHFTICQNDDGDEYVMYEPFEMSDEEKELTLEKLQSIFHKYTDVVCGYDVVVEEVSCEEVSCEDEFFSQLNAGTAAIPTPETMDWILGRLR